MLQGLTALLGRRHAGSAQADTLGTWSDGDATVELRYQATIPSGSGQVLEVLGERFVAAVGTLKPDLLIVRRGRSTRSAVVDAKKRSSYMDIDDLTENVSKYQWGTRRERDSPRARSRGDTAGRTPGRARRGASRRAGTSPVVPPGSTCPRPCDRGALAPAGQAAAGYRPALAGGSSLADRAGSPVPGIVGARVAHRWPARSLLLAASAQQALDPPRVGVEDLGQLPGEGLGQDGQSLHLGPRRLPADLRAGADPQVA